MSALKKQPRVLIVGGASFLGNKLTSTLLSQNCFVTVVDKAQDETARYTKEFERLSHFKFVAADVAKEIPQNLGQITHIYDMAGVEEYLKDAKITREDLLVNSVGTDNLLKFAVSLAAKFILVSTIDVYQGVISQTSLENYFGPKLSDFAHYSHHEAKRFAESLTASYFQNSGVDCSVVRIAQIFGPGMDLTSNEICIKLINQAVKDNPLVITGDGLEKIYPTYVDDVVWGLVKTGFANETRGGIYNLISLDSVTVLEFTNRLKEAYAAVNQGRSLEIVFEEGGKPLKFPIPKIDFGKTEHDLGWKPKVDLAQGLKNTLESFLQRDQGQPEPEVKVQEVATETPAVSRLPKIAIHLPPISLPKTFSLPKLSLRKNSVITILLLLVFLLLVYPAGQIAIGTIIGLRSFKDAKAAFLKTDFTIAKAKSNQATKASKVAKAGFKKVKPAFIIARQEKLFNNLNQNFEGITTALTGFGNLVEAGQISANLAQNVILGEDYDVVKKLSDLDLKLQQSITAFETAKLDLAQPKLSKAPFVSGEFKTLIAQLDQNLPNLKKAGKLAKLLPEFIAVNGQKSYLLLLENNAELRPGGGFIGSYGILKFENGKLLPPTIDDVYNLDGQLKVPIPPPAPLKQYLGVENWGLRDSNWHYDFSKNGVQATAVYSTITGNNVDGVIGIDVATFASLLKVLGPVRLSDYNEEITAGNLAERAEYYSEINFFPGSTSKKDFLGALARQLILKFQQDRGLDYLGIVKVLAQAADEKHVSFYFVNPALETFFADSNWAGLIKSISVQQDGQTKITSDFLLLSEANVGANKSNRFIKKEIKLAPIILRDGDLISTLEINFQNTSPAPTWPGGNYKNYFRIITPAGSKLEQLKIGDLDVTSSVEQSTEADKQIFAVFLEVPAGEKRLVTVVYRPNYRIEVTSNVATYSLLIQKQSGTGEDSVSISLAYPGYLKTPKSNLPSNFSEQKVVSNQKLSTDLNFVVELSL